MPSDYQDEANRVALARSKSHPQSNINKWEDKARQSADTTKEQKRLAFSRSLNPTADLLDVNVMEDKARQSAAIRGNNKGSSLEEKGRYAAADAAGKGVGVALGAISGGVGAVGGFVVSKLLRNKYIFWGTIVSILLSLFFLLLLILMPIFIIFIMANNLNPFSSSAGDTATHSQ